MKLLRIIFFLLLLCKNLPSVAQDTLFWKAADTLTWNDFKGMPNRSARYLAISATGITYTYRYTDAGLNFQVRAFFVRSKSWRNYGTDLKVLKHEQGHFDITEIYARKLASQMQQLKPTKSNFRKSVEALGESIINEKNKTQKQYDLETGSGTKRKMQRKWETAIQQQLEGEPGCCKNEFYPGL
ncbi:MAG: DUF922 domain-containing protein [Bacteroidota bacterium]